MSQNKLQEIDARIASLTTSIAKIEGELQGLRFARNLMALGNELKIVADNEWQPKQVTVHHKLKTKISVRGLILDTLARAIGPMTYSQMKNAIHSAGTVTVNKKTVSSSLNYLKTRKVIIHENRAYRLPTEAEKMAG
jgi:hypothetical protein